MIRVGSLRFATLLLALGMAGFSAVRGMDIMRFGLAEHAVTDDNIQSQLAPFSSSQGLASLVRRDLLNSARNTPSVPLNEKIMDQLSETPASGMDWAQLAQAHLAEASGLEKAFSALSLSSLTGPNESDVMAQRVVTALAVWESLPPDLRRAAISDTIAAWPVINMRQRQALMAVLTSADDKTRAEIHAALNVSDRSGELISKSLGLELPASQ